MSLFDGIAGKNYEIKGLYVEEGITRRLQALGLNDGTVISVLNRKKKRRTYYSCTRNQACSGETYQSGN